MKEGEKKSHSLEDLNFSKVKHDHWIISMYSHHRILQEISKKRRVICVLRKRSGEEGIKIYMLSEVSDVNFRIFFGNAAAHVTIDFFFESL